jgi:hypothetical protein
LKNAAQVMNAVSDAGEILIIPARRQSLPNISANNTPKSAIASLPWKLPSDREIVAYAKKYFKIGPARAAAASGSITR